MQRAIVASRQPYHAAFRDAHTSLRPTEAKALSLGWTLQPPSACPRPNACADDQNMRGTADVEHGRSCRRRGAAESRHNYSTHVSSKFVRNLLKTKKSVHNYSTQKRGVRGSRKTLCQRQICFGVQRRIGALAGDESRVSRRGDHGGVVGRKRAAREIDFDSSARAFRFERAAQLAIGRHAAGNENRACGMFFGRGECAREQVIHHGALEACDQIERRGARKRAQVRPRCVRRAPAPAVALRFPARAADCGAGDTAPRS